MRTITLEEHVCFPAITDLMPKNITGKNAFYSLPSVQRVAHLLADTAGHRISSMDQNHIGQQVLSVAGPGAELLGAAAGPVFAMLYNDLLATRVAEHPDRFMAFAHLPMTNPNAAANELERTVKQYNFKGALISGTTGGRFLDDKAFAPLLCRAEQLGVPLYLHPGFPPAAVFDAYYQHLPKNAGTALAMSGWGWHAETGLHVLRMILAGTLDKYPMLNLIIGHMGEMLPMMLARCDEKFGTGKAGINGRSVSETIRQQVYATTSGVFTVPPLVIAMETFGIDRIMFSVDYPLSSNEQGLAFLDSLPLTADQKDQIAYRNAAKLLGL